MDLLQRLLGGIQNLFGGNKQQTASSRGTQYKNPFSPEAQQIMSSPNWGSLYQQGVPLSYTGGQPSGQVNVEPQFNTTQAAQQFYDAGQGGSGGTPEQQWAQKHGGEGVMPVGYNGEGGGGIMDTDSLVNAIVDPVSKALDSWRQKLEEFDKNNPFAFDEAQARASAGERLNPYYDATLNEYMKGYRRSSARSLEDMTRTIGELNTDASKLNEKERLATQEAIRSSEEGFAGAGLFFSGKRERSTGYQEVVGAMGEEDRGLNLQRNLEKSQQSNLRTQEDLALQQARTKRLTEAERTTALETDISKQKSESEYKRNLERMQFAGFPLGTNQQFTMENDFLGQLR